MGRKKVTSSDVAAASGVSQATVSMILNRRENVSFSRETVEKVEAAAKELGYQIPRRKMRRESNGNKLIVVFCPTLTNPYYVMLLHGIEEVAKEKNYGVFVCNTQRDLKIEENYLRMMKSVRPRGIIYTCNPSRSCKEKVEELAAEIPLVIINNREELFVQTAKGFTDRFRIDIRTEQEVTAIRPDKKEVEIKNLSTGETYTETYDKLVLSPGAEPLRPGIEGIGSKKIFTLRNVPDTDTIKNYVNTENPKRAIVVGGGFIGLEMAENLYDLGIQVDVVEMANQVMAPLDFSMAAIVHRQLTDKGVGLHLEDGVSRFEEKDGGVTVHLRSGKQIATDMVLLSIGVRPETKLAKDAGLAIGERGGITVNDYMQTSDADIYALGDAVEVRHLVTGQPALIPLAGPANKQGRIVADNIVFGNKKKYPGSIGTSIAKVFDLTVAAAGANAKLLQQNNIPYISSYTHGASHAGYYPGAVPLSIKILFAPENGKLLGAQIVGFNGVDKRIEMLAQVIQRGGTVHDWRNWNMPMHLPIRQLKIP